MKTTKQLAIAAATAAIVCSSAISQPARADDGAPATTIALKAAHLFDSTGTALRDGAILVISADKIVSVGNGAISPGVKVIDLGDATILPGFIDAHVHLTDEIQKNYYLGFYKKIFRFPAEQAHYAALYSKRTLEAGFTTVRMVGAKDFLDVGLRNAVNAGVAQGPRILTAVHAIGSTGGHCDQSPFPPDRIKPVGPIEGVCNGADSCREAVRQQLKYGADVIKICASGGVLSESDPVDVPQLTNEELTAIITEAHKWRRKVAAHCHGDLAAKLAVQAGVDSIEHGSFLSEETLRLMKARGVYLVPTRMAGWWINKDADQYPPQIAAKARAANAAAENVLRNAIRIGVPIAFGTDSGVSPHGMNAIEFGLLTDAGMTPANALIAGTREASKLLAVDGDRGTLEAGKLADIVAVPGNVLQNIHATEHPLFVMKGGQVIVQKTGS